MEYLLKLSKEQLGAVQAALLGKASNGETEIAEKVARSLSLYFTPEDQGVCADCGKRFKDGAGFVSPEGGPFVEVMLEGLKAMEAKPRNLCYACHAEAYQRVTGEKFPFPDNAT